MIRKKIKNRQSGEKLNKKNEKRKRKEDRRKKYKIIQEEEKWLRNLLYDNKNPIQESLAHIGKIIYIANIFPMHCFAASTGRWLQKARTFHRNDVEPEVQNVHDISSNTYVCVYVFRYLCLAMIHTNIQATDSDHSQ